MVRFSLGYHISWPGWSRTVLTWTGVMALAAAMAFGAPSVAGVAQAAGGDNLADAVDLATLTFPDVANTTTATREIGEIGSCGNFPPPPANVHSVWYKYTASADGWYTVNTMGSDYDTVLEAFLGPAGAPTYASLTPIVCNDDIAFPYRQSEVTFQVTAGSTYYVVARDNGAGAGGTLHLSASFSTQHQIYVDKVNGWDSNPGTLALPVKTIAKGVNLVLPGGMVTITTGAYYENVTVNKSLTFGSAGTTTVSSFTLTNGAVVSSSVGVSAPVVNVNQLGMPGTRVQDALRLVAESGTVNVGAGIYTETVTVSKTVTLSGVAGAAVIQPPHSTAGAFVISAAGTVTVTGFTLQNAAAAINVTAGSGHVITLNNIVSSTVGVAYAGPSAVAALSNWWGSPTGPAHASNPGGVGLPVADQVNFSPWCSLPVPACTPRYGIPTRLVYTQQPGDGEVNTPLPRQPIVQAQDEAGHLGYNFNGPVTLTIGTGPGGASLLGTTTIVAVHGVVTYTNIALDRPYVGYTLQAAGILPGGPVSTMSAPFNVGNTPPTAVADTPPTIPPMALILEDGGARTIDVLANDFDPDPGDAVQIVSVSQPPNGVVVADTSILTYTPNLNFWGTDVFSYTITDKYASGYATAIVTVTVTPVNDAPSFVPGSDQVVDENAGLQTVPNWATGISPGPNESGQTVNFVTSNNNNALFSAQPAVAPNGTLTFTPASDQHGVAIVFVYLQDDGGTANGGVDTSSVYTFTITVTAVNAPPSFQSGPDPVVVLEDSGPYSAVWATAVSPGPNEAEQTVYFLVTSTNPALFAVLPAIDPAGILTFRPAANANGTAIVEATLFDNLGAHSATASFGIRVTAVNDAPSFTLNTMPIDVFEDTPGDLVYPGRAYDMSAGPADEAGQALSFEVATTNDAAFGRRPAIDTAGTLSFTLAADAFGVVTVSVRLRDNGGTANGGTDVSLPQTFVINIVGVNDPPIFRNGGDVTVNEDTPLFSSSWAAPVLPGPGGESGNVTFTVTNTNNSLFSSQPFIGPAGGLTFQPAPNLNGSATVYVTAHDDGGTANGGNDTSATVTFQIFVLPVNDAPTFALNPGPITVAEDSGTHSYSNWASAMSVGPAEEPLFQHLDHFEVTNGHPLSFTVQPTLDLSGTLSFTVANDAFGVVTVTVRLYDDGGTANGGVNVSAPQTFVINITPMPDPPTANADTAVILEDSGPNTIWVLANDSIWPDAGEILTVTRATNGLHGIAAVISPTAVSYAPLADYFGEDTFVYEITDGVYTATAVVTVTILPVNDAPEFNLAASGIEVAEDSGAHTYYSWAIILPPRFGEAGQTLAFQVLTNSAPALFQTQPAINPAGTLTFTPAPNAAGVAAITVQLQDNGGREHGGMDTSLPRTFTITVTPVNDPPLVVPDTAGVMVGSSTAIAVLANDSDIDGGLDPASVQVISAPAAGTAVVDPANGVITYTPVVTYSTVDTFTYRVCDTGTPLPAQCGSAVVTVTIGALGPEHKVYLPLVMRNAIALPDLVGSFRLEPAAPVAGSPVTITVVITNQGNVPAGYFWVDFYITSTVIAPAVNRPWNLFGQYGLAWYITSTLLAPGQSITLTSTLDSYYGPNTNWPGYFVAGTRYLYLLVDSWNPTVSTGAVLESNEDNNLFEWQLAAPLSGGYGSRLEMPALPPLLSPRPTRPLE